MDRLFDSLLTAFFVGVDGLIHVLLIPNSRLSRKVAKNQLMRLRTTIAETGLLFTTIVETGLHLNFFCLNLTSLFLQSEVYIHLSSVSSSPVRVLLYVVQSQ